MQNIITFCSGLMEQAVNTILPPRCVVSGEIVDRQGVLSPETWTQLDFIAQPYCKKCGLPFEFDVGEDALCVACLERPPSFDSARAALKYNDASRSLILGFKHGDKTHAVQVFAPWLKRSGAEMLERADILVPVPLHRWRLLRRRYNQAALIAKGLSQYCGIAHMPDALGRVRATTSQGHLGRGERAKNVRGAFQVSPSRLADIKGKSVVLVDDVYTSGATVMECTKALKKAGAAEVHVLTLARVVRAGDA